MHIIAVRSVRRHIRAFRGEVIGITPIDARYTETSGIGALCVRLDLRIASDCSTMGCFMRSTACVL